MTRSNRGARIGTWSLRLDAAYCAVLGILIAALSGIIADGVGIPAPLLVVIGLAVVAWAGSLLWMLNRLPLGTALRVVMIANLCAAVVVGVVSGLAATVLVIAAVLAVAVDIALFAVSQGVALRALPAAK